MRKHGEMNTLLAIKCSNTEYAFPFFFFFLIFPPTHIYRPYYSILYASVYFDMFLTTRHHEPSLVGCDISIGRHQVHRALSVNTLVSSTCKW